VLTANFHSSFVALLFLIGMLPTAAPLSAAESCRWKIPAAEASMSVSAARITESMVFLSGPAKADTLPSGAQFSRSGPSLLEQALMPVLGLFVGGLAGGIGATLLPARYSDAKMTNGFRGVILGAAIGPFVFHELQVVNQRGTRSRSSWSIEAGANYTMTNHPAGKRKAGFSAGITRHYPMGSRFELSGSAACVRRSFALPKQRVYYGTPAAEEIRIYDINHSVDYLDIALLANYCPSAGRIRFQFGAGPGVSIQLHENKPFHLLGIDETKSGLRNYDFIYSSDEPASTLPFLNYVLSFAFQAGSASARIRYRQATGASHQIYHLEDSTRLKTLEFVLGFDFTL